MVNAERTFTAKIFKVGINPCVEVPKRISESFRKGRYIPVKGKLNDFGIKATLVPAGNGFYRLYVNGDMRKGARVGVGDIVRVSLRYDPADRARPIPPELAGTLKTHGVFPKFMALKPSRRNEILTYHDYLKTTEGKNRNARRLVEYLKGSPR
jgi:hypothetical protein